MKTKTKILFYTMILVVLSLILVASLWNIDWVMWYKSSHWYYPFPGYWDRKVERYELGNYVNIQYYQIALVYSFAIIVSFLLGYEVKRSVDNQGGMR